MAMNKQKARFVIIITILNESTASGFIFHLHRLLWHTQNHTHCDPVFDVFFCFCFHHFSHRVRSANARALITYLSFIIIITIIVIVYINTYVYVYI